MPNDQICRYLIGYEELSLSEKKAADPADAPSGSPGSEFTLALEPDYCCGGGHCGPLPGYDFRCPSCGKDSADRLGDYLQVGEILTCYFCRRRMRAIERIGDFEYRFEFAD